jgi:hypothetical protein
MLGVREWRRQDVSPIHGDHCLEHVWLFLAAIPGDYGTCRAYGSIKEILEMFPGISRITVDLSLADRTRLARGIGEFQRMRLDSVGLILRPVKAGDRHLVIEQASVDRGVKSVVSTTIPAGPVVKSGVFRNLWRKIRHEDL